MVENADDHKAYKLGEILITEDEIKRRAAGIGDEISRSLDGEPVLIVGILKGAVMWMSDLIKQITAPVIIDFIAVSSYGAAVESSGVVRIIKDLDIVVSGLNVIIVEDIIDSGVTLNYVTEILQARGPKSLKICVLLDKPARRKADIEIDYVGFTIDDLFVVGYGLDVDQRYRNLPYITYIK